MATTRTYLSLEELRKFISSGFNIKGFLLEEECLYEEREALKSYFHNFESEDDFYLEERKINNKISSIKEEIKRFSVSAKGRSWKSVMQSDKDCIIINNSPVYTTGELLNYTGNHKRYKLDNNRIYTVYFELYRFNHGDNPWLTFYLVCEEKKYHLAGC